MTQPKMFKLMFAIALLALLFASGCSGGIWGFSLDFSGKAAQTEAEGRKAVADANAAIGHAKASAVSSAAHIEANAAAADRARQQAEWEEKEPVRATKNQSVSTWWKSFPIWTIAFTVLAGGGTVLAYVYYINRRAALQSSVVVLPADRPVVIPLGDRILALSPPTEVGPSGALLDTLSGDVIEFGPHGEIADVLNTKALAPPKPNALAQIVATAMARRGLAPPPEVLLIENKGSERVSPPGADV